MSEGYNKMTVGQLKEELTQRGLEITGKKADLIQRLIFNDGTKAIEEGEEEEEQVAVEEEQIEQEEENAGEEASQAEGEGEADAVKEEQIKQEEAEEAQEGTEAVGENGGAEQEDDDEKAISTAKTEALDDDELNWEGETAEEKAEGDSEEPKEYEDIDSDPNFMHIKWTENKNITIPVRDQIRSEILAETDLRSVVLYPLAVGDLAVPSITALTERCLHFYASFRASVSQTDKTEQGCLELMFRSREEAMEVSESTEPLREGFEVKHLGDLESKNEFKEWKKENQKAADAGASDSILNRLLFVGNLPPSTEETQLHELFAEGTRAILGLTEDKEPRGYGYVLYETETQVEEAIKASQELEHDGNKLCVMKCIKEKPSGMLSDLQRENIVKKIRAVRNTLKYRGNMMSFEDQHYQKTVQSRLLAKLRGDTNVRREHGLLPPERMKMLEERDAKYKAQQKDKPEGVKPTGNRGRGRGGPGYTPRGGFRGNRGGFPRGGGQWGNPGPRGSWGGRGGPRGGGRGGMAMAMDLLQNISHALGGRGGRGGRGGAGQQGFRQQEGQWGQQSSYGQQSQQGNWGNKRRASNEGGYGGDWKRPRNDGWRGGFSRGGGGGGQRQQNWY